MFSLVNTVTKIWDGVAIILSLTVTAGNVAVMASGFVTGNVLEEVCGILGTLGGLVLIKRTIQKLNFNKQVKQLEDVANDLETQVDSFSEENEKLKSRVSDFSDENNKFSGQNDKLEENLKIQKENADNEIEKLKMSNKKAADLHNKMLEMLKMHGDNFTGFSQAISTNVSKFEDNNDRMEALIETLTQTTFTDLDINNDGKVSLDELKFWQKKHKK